MSHLAAPARRATLAAAAMAMVSALLLSGCASSDAPTPSASTETSRVTIPAEEGAFPVTLEHAFGTFALDKAPERVVTIGWASDDIVAALGVMPIAVPSSWAGDDDGLVPWFREVVEEAGVALPETLNDLKGGEIDFEQILGLRPDAIIAPFSGISETDYKRLTEIAPTLAYPDKPWFLNWQHHTLLVGKAIGRPSLAKKLVDDTNANVARHGSAHPEFADSTFVYSTAISEGSSDVGFYTPSTSMIGIIEDLGLTLSPQVVERAKSVGDQIYFGVSVEEIDTVKADVFIGLVNTQDDVDYALGQTLFARWKPIADGRTVWLTDRQESMAISAPSVLSVPWVMESFVPQLADALAKK